MQIMNEFLAKTPFDLYELNLFHLVARRASFTKAGQEAGLSQSAITRQIRGMEDRLGIALLERTTRHVKLTRAGARLFEKSDALLAEVNGTLRELQRDFNLVPQTIRVGISRSIGFAYLPGFFFAFRKKFPEMQIQLQQEPSKILLQKVENNELDVALLSPPPHLPRGLQITHRFNDDFTIIAPPQLQLPRKGKQIDTLKTGEVLMAQRWILIDRESNTGKRMHHWLAKNGLRIEPAMEMDNFDVIVNLVSLGMGVSLVPHRVLPIYFTRRSVQKVSLKAKFSRELVVVVRKNRTPAKQVTSFVESILF
jgi:DNA-binding transcriptional LysR family regulator